MDDLQEKVAEFDDYVQSTDVAAMQSALDVYGVFLGLMNVSRALDGTCLGGEERAGEDVIAVICVGCVHRGGAGSCVRRPEQIPSKGVVLSQTRLAHGESRV